MTPEAAMRLALAQARRASGRTSPNPPVGAVVLRGGRVLGRGATQPPGGPHAEVMALRDAVRRHGARAVRGATVAVTLEPCSHHGRTGPCTEALLAAGVAAVWAGHPDPNPRAGGGFARLRRAGVEVRSGILEAECREQHRGFLSLVARRRPFVALKLASTLDGRIATAGGESRWISGPAARARVHALRARSDAILVGAGTARADDPELTARAGGAVRRRPLRLVLDSGLALPRRLRLFSDGHPGRTWVLCAASAPAARRRALERAGVRVLPLPQAREGLDLRAGLRRLGEEGVAELLVEGGGAVAASLLRAGLVDELHWFVSPLLLGADARPALGALRLGRLAGAPRLAGVRWARLAREDGGADLYLRGRLAQREAATARRARGPGRKGR